jgi:hypothetical protein
MIIERTKGGTAHVELSLEDCVVIADAMDDYQPSGNKAILWGVGHALCAAFQMLSVVLNAEADRIYSDGGPGWQSTRKELLEAMQDTANIIDRPENGAGSPQRSTVTTGSNTEQLA